MRQRRRCNIGTTSRLVWLIAVLLLQPHSSLQAQTAEPLKGVALVIGQSKYEKLPSLPNTSRDAKAIKELLEKLGFKVDIAPDKTARQLSRWFDGFIEDAESADVALVYYAGHAIEAGGMNYLIPVDADVTSLDSAGENFISLQDMLDRLRMTTRITIILLDACRSNPFPEGAFLKYKADATGIPIRPTGLGPPRGMNVIESSPATSVENLGEVISFAAGPGQAALDGPAGSHSPYAAALLKHLNANQGYEFSHVMTMVTEEVYLATRTRQRPWTNASLRRFLSFGGTVVQTLSDDALIAGERRKLLLTIANTPQETRAFVEAMAQQQSLPLDLLYGMLKELKVDTSAGPDKLERQIREGVANLRRFMAERAVSLRNDEELVRLSKLADQAQAEGAVGLAKIYRADAARRADTLKEAVDQRDAENTADRLELASAYGDYAETALLAYDFKTAAQQYGKAYAVLQDRDPRLAARYRRGEANAFAFQGGSNPLKRAIELYHQALDLASSDTDPQGWARTQHNLGLALKRLGVLEGDRSKLYQAVAAYEAALTRRKRESTPQRWASTKHNLGNALFTLGEMTNDPAFFNGAATAYRAALEVRTRKDAPKDWEATWDSLGYTLVELTERGDYTVFWQIAATENPFELVRLAASEFRELIDEAD